MTTSEWTTRGEVNRRNSIAQELGFQSYDDQVTELRKIQDTARRMGIFMGEALQMVHQETGKMWATLTFQECGTIDIVFRNNRRHSQNPELRDVSKKQAILFWRIMGLLMDSRSRRRVSTFVEWFNERWSKYSGPQLDQFLADTLVEMEKKA